MRSGVWVKSAASNNASQCVELLFTSDGRVKVADTKQNGEGPVLEFDAAEWAAFIEGTRTGAWVPSRP